MKAYTNRQNAVRAARSALGREAVERRDFHLTTSGPDDQIAWHWVEGPEPTPETAAEQPPQTAPEAASEPAATVRPTKGRAVLTMLRRHGGATNAEIMEATGWQTHTVRGFFAGKQFKAMGYKAVRFEREDGTAAYRAEALQIQEA